jgi:GNAT superfamily N-acetyltransferase
MGTDPAHDPMTRTARDGTVVHLRPVRGDDGPRIEELFASSSADTIFNRFLAPLARLEGERLRALTHPEPGTECALAACIDVDGRERMAGVGRFRRVSAEIAEIAIVVGDPWQRHGVGRMLLRQLTLMARDLDLQWFDSTIDPSNLRLLRFVEACGFKGTLKYDGGLLHMRTNIAALFPVELRDPIEDHPRP